MKLERVVHKLLPIIPLLRCPKCGSEFTADGSSLRCEKNHCFDISSRGYLNLMPEHRQKEDKYDEALFLSRSEIMHGMYYAPLRECLIDCIRRYTLTDDFTAIDAGCGEGTHTDCLAHAFPKAQLIGTDISRAAIQRAANGGTQPNWLICNLKNMPFRDHCIDVLLDVLTPADYNEFARILKPGGFFIKVFPEERYLREIRKAVSPYLQDGETYDSSVVERYLKEHSEIVHRETVVQEFPLNQDEAYHFLRMTPMTFSVPQEVLQDIRLSSITIALRVCCCRFS